jgi:putative metalloprotease
MAIEEGIALTRREIVRLSTIAGGISVAAPGWAQFSIGKAISAGKGLAAAESIGDTELKSYFDQVAAETDRLNPIAGPRTVYGRRVAALSRGLATHDGLKLDIKAYMVTDVNAFAMGNGTIRLFKGLLDQLTDDEVRYVIGHEIGHVKNGHSKKRMQTALRAAALQDAAGAAGGKVARLAASEIGDLFKKVIDAQHSQANEKVADDYGLNFLKVKGFQPMGAVTALDKLAAMEAGHKDVTPWLSTHPSPASRARRMRQQLGLPAKA